MGRICFGLALMRLDLASSKTNHGTHAAYVRGCRCTDCRSARREYQRAYLQRKAEAVARFSDGNACAVCGVWRPRQTKSGVCRDCSNKQSEALRSRNCEYCGVTFVPGRKDRPVNPNRFCTVACGNRARRIRHPRTCEACGTLYLPNKGKNGKKQRFCSTSCAHPPREYGPPAPHVCTLCFSPFVGRARKYCDDECSRKAKRMQEAARGSRKGSRINIHALILRDKNVCYLCGKPCAGVEARNSLHPDWHDAPTVEHLIPLSRGGTDTWDNVGLAHMRCNSLKHARETY